MSAIEIPYRTTDSAPAETDHTDIAADNTRNENRINRAPIHQSQE
jgi:hypothetical protein